MKKYPKINTLFQRSIQGKITPQLQNKDTIKALSLIKDLIVEEKVDGTNAQIIVQRNLTTDEIIISYASRNNLIEDKDIMFIKETLDKIINKKAIAKWYRKNFSTNPAVSIYGEVFGYKINTGGNYTGKERNYVVFDIVVEKSWLNVKDRNDVCNELGLKIVPKVMVIPELLSYESFYSNLTKENKESLLAKKYDKETTLEGYIIRPKLSLYVNGGKRVIGKIKCKDFASDKQKKQNVNPIKVQNSKGFLTK